MPAFREHLGGIRSRTNRQIANMRADRELRMFEIRPDVRGLAMCSRFGEVVVAGRVVAVWRGVRGLEGCSQFGWVAARRRCPRSRRRRAARR